LLPVPPWLLQLAGVVAGRRKEVQRLCGSLQVDISQTCRILGWSPPIKIEDGLQRTAEYFLRHNSA
jgi:nucleoside-diphosphate-sugar epimerase